MPAFLKRNYGSNYGELYKPDSQDMGGGRGNGQVFRMDDGFFSFGEDAQKNTASEITSANCNRTWAREYDSREYSITYNLNGGTNNNSNPRTYTRHSKTITLQKPVREGYTFKGWYSDEEFTQKVTKIKLGSTGQVVLYAKWKVKTYDITYKLSGGKNNRKNPADYKITTETIELKKPKKKGYTFKGWYSDREFDKKVTEIKKGSTGDLTLYAKWNAKEYDINYELDGGKNSSSNPESYTVESSSIVLSSPKKTGYSFAGWYSNDQYSKRVTEIKSGSTGDKRLFAKWDIIKYDIAFDGNGSTGGSMNAQGDCKYGSEYSLSQNVFQRTGYTFTGWNTKADGTGTAYADKATVSNLADSNGTSVTLYAQWKLNSYSITYYLNGGVNSSENPTAYAITTGIITLKDPTRTGYTFGGWYSDANFITRVTVINAGSTGNRVLYAKWTPVTYSITYKLNGGTNNSMNPSGYNVTTSTIELQKPTRNGYTFKGWYRDKEYTQKVTKIKKGSTGNKTFYAKWVKK